jgi:hypothetical protein
MDVMCIYCAKYFPASEAYKLHEKGKDHVDLYCPRCYPEVKSNLSKLPWSDVYYWTR